MIKAFIFDFDGVIVDSVGIKTKAFAKLFEHEGEEAVKKVISYHLNNTGISRYKKFKHIYKEIFKKPLTEENFQELCSKFENLVLDNVVKAPYVKGAEEFLKDYAPKFSYFLISATPQKEIEEIVQKRNIGKFFRRIYGAPTKKNDAVREILIKDNLNPVDVVYIGDSMTDYKAAKEHSVKFVAIFGENNSIFSSIDCLKVKNFIELANIFGLL